MFLEYPEALVTVTTIVPVSDPVRLMRSKPVPLNEKFAVADPPFVSVTL